MDKTTIGDSQCPTMELLFLLYLHYYNRSTFLRDSPVVELFVKSCSEESG